MTPRERQLATIRHEVPDRISVDAICIENIPQVVEYLQMNPEILADKGKKVLDAGYAHLNYLRSDVDVLFDRLGIDGRIIQAVYAKELPKGPNGEILTEWLTFTQNDYGTGHAYPLAEASTIADVEKFPWPDPADYTYEAAAEYARHWDVNYAMRGPYWKPLFCQVCELIGMEETMVKMHTDPDVVHAILDGVLRHTYEYCDRFMDACGDALPIFYLGDDFATQRGLMISPDHWRKFLKPALKTIFESAKKRGKFVWFHSCGDITSVLPDLIDIGMDVWETVQLHTLPMSPEQLKKEYGRDVTFFGSVSTQNLPFAAPEEVAEETRRCIEMLGEGGGYICGPDHHIKPDVPAENVVALFEAATGFRREGYTSSL